MVYHRLSKIFQPTLALPKDAIIKNQNLSAKSQKLMLELGIIRQASPGCFHLLPLGLKSLNKLIRLVDEEMEKIGGQKIEFPTLTSTKLWTTSKRLETVSTELFQTYEEAAADLIHSISPISYRQLPLKLYQISSKYRDEMKPRFGLIRAKQFVMKDMYSFDTTAEAARLTYDQVGDAYAALLDRVGVRWTRAEAAPGAMGGSLSHEYHYAAAVGEDRIVACARCAYSASAEAAGACPRCGGAVAARAGVEVGHTFLLGDRYSRPLGATCLGERGAPAPVQMGSFGLGLTRMVAAAVEVLSSETEMRWPMSLVPYCVVVIPPKSGSKEELHLASSNRLAELFTSLQAIEGLKDNILLDDRVTLTIGRRCLDAKRMGYPFIVVLGKAICQDPPLFELLDLENNKTLHLNENELCAFLNKRI